MRRKARSHFEILCVALGGGLLLALAGGCGRNRVVAGGPGEARAQGPKTPPARVEPVKVPTPPPAKLEPGELALFNGKDLTGWEIVDQADFERHGKVYASGGTLMLEQGNPMTGIRWKGPFEFPRDNYEVNVDAMRVSGYDFFCGMTFRVGESPCTLIVSGWGGSVVGLSNVDGENASENVTSTGKQFENNRWYHVRLRVTPAKIEVWIDNEQLIDLERRDHKFEVWIEQSPIIPFGVAAWNTGGALSNFTLRRLAEEKK